MIIWINGTFGAGKTTCAYELARRIALSYVYDPENVGYFIRNNIPSSLQKPDFQDHFQWRLFNYEMLRYLSLHFEGTILVPMTLTNPVYYEEIIGRLLRDGVQIKHYILWADEQTIDHRLKKRLEFGNTWGRQRMKQCMNAFELEITEEKIITDHRSVDSIIEEIAQKSGLSLLPDKRGPLKKQADKIFALIRSIR